MTFDIPDVGPHTMSLDIHSAPGTLLVPSDDPDQGGVKEPGNPDNRSPSWLVIAP